MNKLTTTLAMACVVASSAIGAENLLTNAKEIKAHPYAKFIPNLTDNKMETTWLSYTNANATGTIIAEFNEDTSFQAVAFYGINLAKGTLETSADGKTWAVAGEFKSSNGATLLSFYDKYRVTAKYIRVKLTGDEKDQPIRVGEMKVYDLDVEENLALWSDITESKASGVNYRFPATYLVDGNEATMVSSYSMYKGSTFTIDLKEEKAAKTVQFNSKGNYKSLKLSVAGNDKKFKEIKTLTSQTYQPINFDEQNVRYIEVKVTGRAIPTDIIVK